MSVYIRSYVALGSLGLLVGLLGFQIGSMQGARRAFDIPPIQLKADTRDMVPTVRLNGVHNGNLEGEIRGDVRVFLGDELVVPEEETFSVLAAQFLRNHVTVEVPKGMYFVASKRGKKFYSVASSQGGRIAPENRVYFKTAEEARTAGYRE